MPRSRGRAERNERAGGHASDRLSEERSDKLERRKHACPQATFPHIPALCPVYLFICVIQSPPRAGRGAAELSGRSRPMRRRSKGARTDRREDGGRAGEWTIWIFPSALSVYLCNSKPPAGGAGGGRAVWPVSPHATEEQRGEDGQARGRGAGGGEDNFDISFSCLCSFILSAMVQYSVSNNTKSSHTDHIRCSVMLFPYAPFDMLLDVFSYILFRSIRYSLFVLQSSFTQILLELEIRLRYYCTAIFQTTKAERRNRTITVTVTPAMNPPCAFFPVS